MLERTSTTERYVRGAAAAIVAVAALLLAANAGPARAAGTAHEQRVQQTDATRTGHGASPVADSSDGSRDVPSDGSPW
ncbi:hypothetical protein [Streptomyces sp. NPDC000983]|uniref:hypothetical protein n=1 Tax=Streptomyces sp. NPDC000983 TaxID=3154373 RepID=UPI00332F44A3